jgi:hypothetical protein
MRGTGPKVCFGIHAERPLQRLIPARLIVTSHPSRTWFHEMGHGIAAMLAGSSFELLLIFLDGSGVALSTRPMNGLKASAAT